MRNAKYLIWIVLILLSGIAGWKLNSSYNLKSSSNTDIQVSLSDVQDILKLALVEMEFSEILSHERFESYDWEVFSGKMIFRVNGRVSAGYNATNSKLILDSLTKTIKLLYTPEPELLSVESDLKYYNIQEGLFFSFKEADYNETQKMANEAVTNAARTSELLSQAENRWEEVIDNVSLLLQATGWKLEVEKKPKNSWNFVEIE